MKGLCPCPINKQIRPEMVVLYSKITQNATSSVHGKVCFKLSMVYFSKFKYISKNASGKYRGRSKPRNQQSMVDRAISRH